jgi:ABC-type branched-subunit amino acid transport system substrate-binding protein
MKHIKKYGLFLAFAWPQWTVASDIDVTMHYVGPTDGQVWLGVQQGIEEANLQGGFLGQKYQVKVVEPNELESTNVETVVLLATDDDYIMKVAQSDKFAAIPVINLISSSDALREACLPNLFHVTPSESMRADALAQWQEKNSDKPAKVQSWHEDFVKFAASQLNNRFEKNQGEEMTDDAWAGWAGTKMVADSVVQTMQFDAAFMLNHLKNDLVFDGQKGDNTNFRENGQLRQILLMVDNDNKIVAEAPLRGFEGGLDSLGKVTCK